MDELISTGVSIFTYWRVMILYGVFVFVATLGVDRSDLLKQAVNLKAMVAMVTINALFVPIVGVLVGLVFYASHETGGGLIFVALMPAQALCVLLTWVAGGSVALSLVLLVLSNIVAVAALPVSALLISLFSPVPYVTMAAPADLIDLTVAGALLAFVLPILAGLGFQHLFPRASKGVFKVGMYIAVFFVLVGPLNSIHLTWGWLSTSVWSSGMIVMFAYLFLFMFTYFASHALNNSVTATRAITFCVLTTNGSMAVYLYVSSGHESQDFLNMIVWWFNGQYYMGMIAAVWLRMWHSNWLMKGVRRDTAS